MKTIRYLFACLSILFLSECACAQPAPGNDYLSWSATRKLAVEDFLIRKKPGDGFSSAAQFSVQFDLQGFAFLKRNFNRSVHNYFIKSASWIDTSFDTATSLRYQQTLFDICEIYTRRFRHDLKANRKRLAGKNDLINELNAKAMSDFAKRRMLYDDETGSGSNAGKQLEWEMQIRKELDELKDFAVE
jgi:hypothetical protein